MCHRMTRVLFMLTDRSVGSSGVSVRRDDLTPKLWFLRFLKVNLFVIDVTHVMVLANQTNHSPPVLRRVEADPPIPVFVVPYGQVWVIVAEFKSCGQKLRRTVQSISSWVRRFVFNWAITSGSVSKAQNMTRRSEGCRDDRCHPTVQLVALKAL